MNTVKKEQLFKGAATAVITPFKNGSIDFSAFEKILDFQINSGINALVICGTTGEASTLSESEWKNAVAFSVKFAKGRIPIIAGCGSNSTETAQSRASAADKLGADALLCVTPYYNKATAQGLILHYKKVASATEKPLILYNVPSRTGVDIPMEVYDKLQDTQNVLGIKEASGNAAKSAEIISTFKDRYAVYSGADEINLPILAIGGDGVISVLSNVLPRKVVELCDLVFSEDIKGAASLSAELFSITKALFCEVNPIPVKTALSEMGFCEPQFRLPLCNMSEKNKLFLKNAMMSLNLI